MAAFGPEPQGPPLDSSASRGQSPLRSLRAKTPAAQQSSRLMGTAPALTTRLVARSSYFLNRKLQFTHCRTELMRPSPAICHIGKSALSPGRDCHTRHLFQVGRIDFVKYVSPRRASTFGDSRRSANLHPLRVMSPADHGNQLPTPQRIASATPRGGEGSVGERIRPLPTPLSVENHLASRVTTTLGFVRNGPSNRSKVLRPITPACRS